MEIEVRIKELLRNNFKMGEMVDALSLETPIKSMGINSIDFIKFVVALETEFDITFDDEQLAVNQFQTFGDILSYVESMVNVNN